MTSPLATTPLFHPIMKKRLDNGINTNCVRKVHDLIYYYYYFFRKEKKNYFKTSKYMNV